MGQICRRKQRDILITGGTGFLGSNLARRLLDAGTRVRVLARRAETPVARELLSRGALVLSCDFTRPEAPTDPSKHAQLAALDHPDLMLHFAAETALRAPTLQASNVDGTQRALDLAAALGVPYFVYASSIEAQGSASDREGPLNEDAPSHPVSAYGQSKREAEDLVNVWGMQTGRASLVLRIGNIYGPGSAWMLQSSLMTLLGITSFHPVWPRLKHRRFQPLYVDDLVEGVLRAVEARLTGLYNLTGAVTVSVEEYLRQLVDLLGLRDLLAARLASLPDSPSHETVAPDFAYLLMGEPDRCHRIYDNTKLKGDIGEYGRWSLQRGLAATLQWYREAGLLASLLHAVRQRGHQSCMSH
jgi:nucleoside-diphosphate-sugar epimerase